MDAINARHVSAYGPGLSHGMVNKPATFTIVTKDAGEGESLAPRLKTPGHGVVSLLKRGPVLFPSKKRRLIFHLKGGHKREERNPHV